MGAEPIGSPIDEPGTRAEAHLKSALLFCEQCGADTPHRIFRVRRGGPGGRGALEGVARCRQCRTTHPFESRPSVRTQVSLIVSDGPTSGRTILSLPPETRLEVGAPLPEHVEPLIVRRIDPRSGSVRSGAPAREVATVWATRDVGAIVKVSIIEGRLTRPGRIVVPPETVLEVGGFFTIDREQFSISALRARGKTWRLPGDAFPAGEVQRIYGRRTETPPAGRSDWRSDRSIPSSRTSSSSRAERSRSSPGVTRTRTSPRARTALSGAAVQRS